jgi:hypothetical protein
MSQPIHTSISHGYTEKESTVEEGRPRRGKRPRGDEHWDRRKNVKYRPADSAGRCTMSRNSEEDEISSILEECLSVIRSGLLQDIKIDDLVFCESSNEDDPHTPHTPPPLQRYATTNTQFLQYQDWIRTLSLDAEKLDCEGFERCRKLKCQLLDDLRDEWTRLEELKRRAWQLTSRNAALTMPPCPRADPGLVQEIDTCEYQSDPMRCN